MRLKICVSRCLKCVGGVKQFKTFLYNFSMLQIFSMRIQNISLSINEGVDCTHKLLVSELSWVICEYTHWKGADPIYTHLLHSELISGTPTLKINHGSGTVVLQLPGNINVADRRWHRLDIRSNSKVGRTARYKKTNKQKMSSLWSEVRIQWVKTQCHKTYRHGFLRWQSKKARRGDFIMWKCQQLKSLSGLTGYS